MASSRGVQQHEVNTAADALVAERLRPTIERIRTKIGRGSPNTVAPMLERWFESLAPRLGVAPAEEGGGAIPAAVLQSFQGIWDTALSTARQEAVTALEAQVRRVEEDRAALTQARVDLEARLTAAAQREELLNASFAHAQKQVTDGSAQLQRTLESLRERERELVDVRSSLANAVQAKDAAAREHAEQLRSAAAERERIESRAAGTEKRLLEDVDRARQEAKASRKALAETEDRLAAKNEESSLARDAHAGAVHALQLERAQLLERIAGAERRVGEIEKRGQSARTRPARRPATASLKKKRTS